MEEFTELIATAIANSQARSQLAASRARAVTAADDTRRRIERDLHDGVQQRLVTVGLELRAAREEAPPGLSGLGVRLGRVADDLAGVVADLQELSRGLHPAILSRGGLVPAVKMLARRSAVPVELDLSVGGRLDERVEVAVYYVVSEALANIAKHAHATVVRVELAVRDHTLRLSVRDDGIGGADPRGGSGLAGLGDRVEVAGGTLTVRSVPGQGTCLEATIPLRAGRSSAAGAPVS
jgi:signal transduction histidine kinase